MTASGSSKIALRVVLLAVVALLGQGCGDSGPDCKNGLVACNGVCVDFNTSLAHCGSCQGPNAVCPTGATCSVGQCQCPSGQIPCNHRCIDPLTNAKNCTNCGNDCGLGTCSGGTCTCDPPPETVQECTGYNPLCVNITTDPKHCGDCATACTLTNEICAGSCQCPTSLPHKCPEDVPTACVNKATDKKNCGTCGTVCGKTNEQCIDSQCQCPSTYPTACPTSSPAACINTNTDSKNCGSCGNVCASRLTCVGGECKGCASPSTDCSGTCIDTRSDHDHCGGCTTICPTAATCSNSQCVCPGNTTVCGSGSNTTCPTAHTNGLGGTYYDCGLLGNLSATTASKAANAWAPSGSVSSTPPFPYCLSWTNGSQCAVWCYDDLGAGLVHINTGSTQCVRPSFSGETGTFSWM
jgi:hypothetical protein